MTHKDEALNWLHVRGYSGCRISYSGGNDEGGPDDVQLIRAGVPEEEWPSIGWGDEGYDLLTKPIDDRYGSWAGDFSAYGTLTYDVEAGTCVMDNYEQSDYEHDRAEF